MVDNTDDAKNNLILDTRIDGFIPLLCYTMEGHWRNPDFRSSASIDHNSVDLCVFVVTLRIRAHSIQEDSSFDRLLSTMCVRIVLFR